MKLLPVFYLLLALSFSFDSRGQNFGAIFGSGNLPKAMSPEVASLGKYGTYNVNYYSGTPDISIPLHEISEAGFNIPISISYDASGFIPNKNSGPVGHDWNLTAGGAITRQANGRIDETYDENFNDTRLHSDKGYIYGQTHGYGSSTTEHIRTLAFCTMPTQGTDPNTYNPSDPTVANPSFNITSTTGPNYEYQPDIFSFNFLGHSGSFFMDNNGNIQVVSDRKYKVDISQLGYYYTFKTLIYTNSGEATLSSLNTNPISTIVMTSDDGYEFTFGGAFKNLEVSFNFPMNMWRGVSDYSAAICAWYITKAKSPDGNIITFAYDDFDGEDLVIINHLFGDMTNPTGPQDVTFGGWTNNTCRFLEVNMFLTDNYMAYSSASDYSSPTVTNYAKSLIKHCYLKTITTKLQKLTFNYDLKDQFYGTGNIFPPPTIQQQSNLNVNQFDHAQILNNIKIQDILNGGNLPNIDSYQSFPEARLINFHYQTTGNRYFLQSVDFNDPSYNYSFSYNIPPSGFSINPLTFAIDRWGFYNAHTGNYALIPYPTSIDYGTAPEYEVDYSTSYCNRLPNPDVATIGMLNKITYPTKGTTEFTFERHDFGKILKRTVNSGIEPELQNISGIAGGVRIKQIKNTPGVTTDFKYLVDYETGNSTTSSGLLIDNDVHILNFYPNNSGTNGNIGIHAELNDNSMVSSSTYHQNHIVYKEVIAINSEGFTKYKFTNPESNPDVYYDGAGSWKITIERSANQYNNQLLRLFKYSSTEKERGKQSAVEAWKAVSSGYTKAKTTEYTYNTDPNRFTQKTEGFLFSPDFAQGFGYIYWIGMVQSYALYYYHNNVTSIVEKSYSDDPSNAPLTVTTNFTYNTSTSPFLKDRLKEKTITQSDGLRLKHSYKYPGDFASTSPYNSMLIKFILSPVIEETISKETAVNSNTYSVIKINKQNYATFNTSNYKIANVKMVNQQVSPNDQDVLTVSNYSTDGNIIEANKPNDIKTSYIWDYKAVYPVAIVSNAAENSIAYTSFETDFIPGTGSGHWDFDPANLVQLLTVPTGKKCLKINDIVVSAYSLQSSQTYRLSYWFKNGSAITCASGTQSNIVTGPVKNGWTYCERLITGATDVNLNGTGYIDELRLYPENAQMVTYTYEPLVGMTSQCDINNKIFNYTYDQWSRLTVIRDQEMKIIKLYCYNFYGQQEDCSQSIEPAYVFTGYRCKPCDQDPNYISSVIEKVYEDQNPNGNPAIHYSYILATPGNSNPADYPVCDLDVWQNTNVFRCQLTFYNQNTGIQEQKQINLNPCAPTSERWVVIGTNLTDCPLPPPCTTANCSGPDRECVGTACVIGTKWYLTAVYHGQTQLWHCTYVYHWNDPDCHEGTTVFAEDLAQAPTLGGVCD